MSCWFSDCFPGPEITNSCHKPKRNEGKSKGESTLLWQLKDSSLNFEVPWEVVFQRRNMSLAIPFASYVRESFCSF